MSASCVNGVWQKLLQHVITDATGSEKINLQFVSLTKQTDFNKSKEMDVDELPESYSDDMSPDDLK